MCIYVNFIFDEIFYFILQKYYVELSLSKNETAVKCEARSDVLLIVVNKTQTSPDTYIFA